MRSVMVGTRQSLCHVYRAPIAGRGLSPIEVALSKTSKRAHYQGLMTCGSVWACPLCAAKIANRRRNELCAAGDAAHAKGWAMHLVTLTVPHWATTDIQLMLDSMAAATKRMSQGKHAVSVALGDKLKGYIRVLETTHGANGWHPHYHLLVMTSADVSCADLLAIYRPRWRRACRLSGLPIPSDEHGVTVQDGSNASTYISKWGAADEMTKGHMKQSRAKEGLSPMALLDIISGALVHESYTPGLARSLWLSYTNAHAGRRQLHWSVGLRKALALGADASDAEVAAQVDDSALALAEITVPQWAAIRRHKLQSHVLDMAERSVSELHQLLTGLSVAGAELPADDVAPTLARAPVELGSVLAPPAISESVDDLRTAYRGAQGRIRATLRGYLVKSAPAVAPVSVSRSAAESLYTSAPVDLSDEVRWGNQSQLKESMHV